MAGDTLRGIGKKASGREAARAPAGTDVSRPSLLRSPSFFATGSRAHDRARSPGAQQPCWTPRRAPSRSLDDLPSDRTGQLGWPMPGQRLSGRPPALGPGRRRGAGADATRPRVPARRVGAQSRRRHDGATRCLRQAQAAADRRADGGLRGTAHGRDVHLPAAHPTTIAVESEVATSLAQPPPPEPAVASALAGHGAGVTPYSLNESPGGDHTFSIPAPIKDEYEPGTRAAPSTRGSRCWGRCCRS